MHKLFEVNIDPNFHISGLPISHTTKLSVFIPPIEQCIPTENNYFGLEPMTHGNFLISQEDRSLSIPLRKFIEMSLVDACPFVFECASSNPDHIESITSLGQEVMDFARENCVTKTLLKYYLESFIKTKESSPHRSFRYGSILRKLYKNIRTVDMTEEEWDIYYNLKENSQKYNKEYVLVHLDFDLQELEQSCEKNEFYLDRVNMELVNQFLVRIHKTQFGI